MWLTGVGDTLAIGSTVSHLDWAMETDETNCSTTPRRAARPGSRTPRNSVSARRLGLTVRDFAKQPLHRYLLPGGAASQCLPAGGIKPPRLYGGVESVIR